MVERVAAVDCPVYVHCAHGYGRAAMLAAAVLIARGHAANLDEAERLLKRARPKIHLARRQRRLVASSCIAGAQRPAKTRG
jgi:protein-tyrosine phosphatase